jgi:hypothetical protein
MAVTAETGRPRWTPYLTYRSHLLPPRTPVRTRSRAHLGRDDCRPSSRGRGAEGVTLRQVVECSACGFDIGQVPTCDVTGIEIRGRRYERIRYTTYGGKREHTCPGCGIIAPNFRDAGCEVDICPVCEGALAGCECEYVFVRAE